MDGWEGGGGGIRYHVSRSGEISTPGKQGIGIAGHCQFKGGERRIFKLRKVGMTG